MSTPDPASQATDDVFAALGAADIPDEDKAILLAKMFEVVQMQVLDRLYPQLTEEQRATLVDLMDQEDPEQVNAYLEQVVPGYLHMYEEEAAKLKQQLVLNLST